ncbi:MAG TPA: response regulator, partial [Paludibacter sp.]|nr:response regulator [Paludibacter sp.]
RQPASPPAKALLIVEESEQAAIQVKDFMVENGYEVTVAKNGKMAIETVSDKLPDAIVMDLVLTDIDGFGVLKFLRDKEETCNIPVLVLTAKQLTLEELDLIRKYDVHQLIHKGDVHKSDLQKAIVSMIKHGEMTGNKTAFGYSPCNPETLQTHKEPPQGIPGICRRNN